MNRNGSKTQVVRRYEDDIRCVITKRCYSSDIILEDLNWIFLGRPKLRLRFVKGSKRVGVGNA